MEILFDEDKMIAWITLAPSETEFNPHKTDRLIKSKGFTRTSPWVYSYGKYCIEVTRTGKPRVGGVKLF